MFGRLLFAGALWSVLLACGPLGPISGGALSGPVAALRLDPPHAVKRDVETVQLETRPEDPYSVNTWWVVHDAKVYVPTSLILGAEEPSERKWVQNIRADPRVRLRVDGSVYELVAVRVEDPIELEAARAALLRKYEEDLDQHARNAWIFRLESR